MEVFGKEERTMRPNIKSGDFPMEELLVIKGARILLTEDNVINQQVATELLEDAGFEVHLALNGREAVDKVTTVGSDRPFDLVLMDLQMPVMDGYQATREIRKSYNSGELPIIAMTADALAGIRESCMEAGMQDYVTKPIDPAILFRTLSKWIKPREIIRDSASQIVKRSGHVAEMPVIPGLNTEMALRRMNNKLSLYLNVLTSFYKENAGICADIRKTFEQKDYGASKRLAHTFKGLCGSIGAERLREQAEELEKTILEQDQPAFDRVMMILEPMTNDMTGALSVQLGQNYALQGRKQDPALAIQIIAKMKEMLQSKNPKAKSLLADLGKTGVEGTDFIALESHINRYDFKNALKSLENIEQKVKKQLNEKNE
jgi:CheY-like chemotaxis protein